MDGLYTWRHEKTRCKPTEFNGYGESGPEKADP